jgi:hypothetical protein
VYDEEDEGLEPEVLTYSEWHRQRTLVDWYERRRLHECGSAARAETGNFAALRHWLADWAVEVASRSSGRSLFRRPA